MSGMRGGIPGKRAMRMYATAKCPMNMSGGYLWISIKKLVVLHSGTSGTLIAIFGIFFLYNFLVRVPGRQVHVPEIPDHKPEKGNSKMAFMRFLKNKNDFIGYNASSIQWRELIF